MSNVIYFNSKEKIFNYRTMNIYNHEYQAIPTEQTIIVRFEEISIPIPMVLNDLQNTITLLEEGMYNIQYTYKLRNAGYPATIGVEYTMKLHLIRSSGEEIILGVDQCVEGAKNLGTPTEGSEFKQGTLTSTLFLSKGDILYCSITNNLNITDGEMLLIPTLYISKIL